MVTASPKLCRFIPFGGNLIYARAIFLRVLKIYSPGSRFSQGKRVRNLSQNSVYPPVTPRLAGTPDARLKGLMSRLTEARWQAGTGLRASLGSGRSAGALHP